MSDYGSLVQGANVRFAGVDQGIDFTGPGTVLALGDAIITRLERSGSGWPGEGALLVYKLVSGPGAGSYVYVAEDFAPGAGLKVGSSVRAGQPIGAATGSGRAPGIEVGWADARGYTLASKGGTVSWRTGPRSRPEGYSFLSFVTGRTRSGGGGGGFLGLGGVTGAVKGAAGTVAGAVTGPYGASSLLAGGPGVVYAERALGLPSPASIFGLGQDAWDSLSTIEKVAQAILHSFTWAFTNWDRALEVLGGTLLLLVGLVILGKRLAGQGPIGEFGEALSKIPVGPAAGVAREGARVARNPRPPRPVYPKAPARSVNVRPRAGRSIAAGPTRTPRRTIGMGPAPSERIPF